MRPPLPASWCAHYCGGRTPERGGEGPYDVKYVPWPYHTEKHRHKGGGVLTFLLKIRLDQHRVNKNA
jgi:hypothetical protein